MGFDRVIKTEMLIGSTAIFPMERMKNLVQRLKIKLGILTVNQGSAQRVCNQMIDAGIKAIWNFSPHMLRVPEDVLVQNENMAMSLAILSKHLNQGIEHKHQAITINKED
jgi:redox-sensing transcriptional repressor